MGWNKNTEELSISINLSACLSAVLDVNLHVYTPQGILIYIKHGFYKSSSVSFIDNESHLRTKKMTCLQDVEDENIIFMEDLQTLKNRGSNICVLCIKWPPPVLDCTHSHL